MVEPIPRTGSLVLYKNRPARVGQVGDKLEIALTDGKRVKVRLKDVTLLHPGPVDDLEQLQPQSGEVEAAWELLAGGTTDLAELAELIYGTYTPATAWATWEWVDDGLYFQGAPGAVLVRSGAEVAQERATRQARTAERQAWEAFLQRVQGGQVAPEDAPYLREAEALALGQSTASRVLRELGRAERPENAHALLLELGHWDHAVDPYPQRLGLDTAALTLALPPLPQEARVDLTHLVALAIDDEGTQDPDDALSLENGRLWVHVADVAALVRPDDPADVTARGRGANLYLPEGTAPMLPPQATQTLGLGLSEVSPALSFGLDLNPAGEVAGVQVVPSLVRVTRLSYADAEAQLAEEPLQGLYRLAQTSEARRRDNDAVLIEMPEVKLWVQDGEVVIRPLPPLKSRALVTEAMLLAGEAVARFALERDLPIPFSTQPPPDSSDRPQDLAGMFALRRTLQRSHMSSVPAPHAGLGLPLYAQATSPLRRYLDLVVHQQLRAHLHGQDLLGTTELLARIGAVEAVTDHVRQAERLARRHWTLVYLLQNPDWRGEGVLVDQRGARATLIIPELDLEPRVHLRQDLPLNSVLSLALKAVNLPELEAYFRIKT